jgi:hypothetical protein
VKARSGNGKGRRIGDIFRDEQDQRLKEMLNPEPTTQWPNGCRGSRCPWLVFVGPSPGGKNAINEKADPRWNSSFRDPMTSWSPGFKVSLQILLETLLNRSVKDGADRLFAVFNFDSVQCSESRRVPEQNMKKGAKGVVDLLEATRPRVIVPMDKSCFDLLKTILSANRYQASTDESFSVKIPINSSPKKIHRQLFGFRILGNGPLRGSVVIKSPQHPARIFRGDYAMACAKHMRKLLENLCADLA